MGHPRSNTSTSTTSFSVSRFGTKAARATQVARAALACASVRECPLTRACRRMTRRGRSQRRSSSSASSSAASHASRSLISFGSTVRPLVGQPLSQARHREAKRRRSDVGPGTERAHGFGQRRRSLARHLIEERIKSDARSAVGDRAPSRPGGLASPCAIPLPR